MTNTRFDETKSVFDSIHDHWNVVLNQKSNNVINNGEHDTSMNTQATEIKLKVKTIVNAAGLWSDTIQNQCCSCKNPTNSSYSKHKRYTSKPRRGQYRIYSSNPNTTITHPIQPIPTQYTKGVFIFSTIYNQLVVGPTAKDQISKHDTSIDESVSDELDSMIQRVIPNINVERDYIGGYVGIRPGTDKRDYQIHLYSKKNWVVVAGIRSTGLTASLGIGNYVLRLLNSILYDDDNQSSMANCKPISTTPLPSIENLIDNFHQRRDGYVNIHGCEYKVTHPLTRIGWTRFNTKG